MGQALRHSLQKGVLPVIILIRKRVLLLSALFCCFLAGLAAVLWFGRTPASPVFAAREDAPVTVVVDAGHGGEDGGAVSPDGVEEGRLNLEIALRVNDLLRFAGQRTRLTRTEDVTIADPDLDTMRQRKASDLKNRVELVNGTENAVLLSIHQNSLPSSVVTHGAQVFWNRQDGAETLAGIVQDALNRSANIGKEKRPKQIPDTIYLMKNITSPGIIVECGFLSNPEETLRLQQPDYQRKLAAAIAAGYLRYAAGEEVP